MVLAALTGGKSVQAGITDTRTTFEIREKTLEEAYAVMLSAVEQAA